MDNNKTPDLFKDKPKGLHIIDSSPPPLFMEHIKTPDTLECPWCLPQLEKEKE